MKPEIRDFYNGAILKRFALVIQRKSGYSTTVENFDNTEQAMEFAKTFLMRDDAPFQEYDQFLIIDRHSEFVVHRRGKVTPPPSPVPVYPVVSWTL